MAEARKKTLSYHRAKFFVDDHAAINLGMCIKQATDKVPVPDRFVQRTEGRIMRLAHFKTDDKKGCFLHLTVDTPGQYTSVVPKTVVETTEVKISIIPPPNDAEFMDGDAFLYVRGNDICLCATTVKSTSIVLFLRQFFLTAGIRKEPIDFSFMHAADTNKLASIQRSGVKHIAIRGTVYKASVDHMKRKDSAMGLLGIVSRQARALLGAPHDVSDDALQVEVTLHIDGRHQKGITLGHRRLQSIAADLVTHEEVSDDYIIVTNDSDEIRPSEVVKRVKREIESMGKSIQRDAAWEHLLEYYEELSKDGSFVQ